MKFRATITYTHEYDVIPKHYGTDDPKKMIEIDKKSFMEMPELFTDESDPEIIITQVE